MSVQNDIKELLNAGVISSDTAQRIEEYYEGRPSPYANKLLAIFAVLGSILIGLGIILILAHNWDDLSRFTKTVISFIPLLIGQTACFYALYAHKNSMAWLEASSAFLFFGVGACIALIAQVYNISSSSGTFMLTWCLLMLPVIYIMRASMVSLLYLMLSTYYVVETNGNILYLGLIAGILPYYYLMFKNDEKSNFLAFFNWLLPTSLLIGAGFILKDKFEIMIVVYLCLFALCYQISNIPLFRRQSTLSNGYKMIGLLGTAIVMLFFSFNWFWGEINRSYNPKVLTLMLIFLSVAISVSLLLYQNRKKLLSINPIGLMGAVFTIVFFTLSDAPDAAQWISNLLIFLIGLYYIRKGAKLNHFGVLNYGLLLVSALIICRFFDSNLSFVIRGLLFIAIGIGLFIINFYMHKKRSTNEQ